MNMTTNNISNQPIESRPLNQKKNTALYAVKMYVG